MKMDWFVKTRLSTIALSLGTIALGLRLDPPTLAAQGWEGHPF
jgi:hypothetical protein